MHTTAAGGFHTEPCHGRAKAQAHTHGQGHLTFLPCFAFPLCVAFQMCPQPASESHRLHLFGTVNFQSSRRCVMGELELGLSPTAKASHQVPSSSQKQVIRPNLPRCWWPNLTWGKPIFTASDSNSCGPALTHMQRKQSLLSQIQENDSFTLMDATLKSIEIHCSSQQRRG